LNRLKPYLKVGRYQEEDEARALDSKIRYLLDYNDIPYQTVDGVEGVAKNVMHIIQENFK
jgi:hypothetical protein